MGIVDALVAQRVESLRNPTGKSFEDRSPDGRWYRILRRRVASGGTVTVMTDVTEQKQAEQDLAAKEAQLLVALDNMPGALVYTDDRLEHRLLQRSIPGGVWSAGRIASAGPAIPRFPALPGRERLLR